ncbi:MAG TPA: dimethyl sulfoxide reductase anchor subunit [Albidovulum sp.]|uniref:dimethyl sulfoxide reductase anchor subunit family protein n=1 Tax=Albidovulum sp. TaxID=1872424 RepID=UPI002B8ED83B|nr:dimethyl sulfoxide reductase anchor subunit [Albidovulum sp.]
MHPAPSVILFTVLSGMGFGLLALLALGAAQPLGLAALLHWGLGYGLAVGGLLASTFHLGNPQRALRAFTQWRTSWLSREGWASVLTLFMLAPVALAAIMGAGLPSFFGATGAAMALLTVYCTAMIYAQLKTVPRWNHWITPVLFLLFALTGGAILTGRNGFGAIMALLLGAALFYSFRRGDGAFAERGATIGSATGLGALGEVRQFAPPHTGGNYLMNEMIFRVGRKHVRRLRIIAILGASLLPAPILVFVPPLPWVMAVAAVIHLVGAFAARWLFFAEAEHVVGLYYDAH